jgi:hypoxanthine phosphoribosyltransferase
MLEKLKTRPLIDEATLQTRIAELGKKITADFRGETVTIIGVLKGSFIFLADLVRKIDLSTRIEFIGVSSYHGTESSGHVRITQDLTTEVKGKNIIVVEDIVDTGLTMDYLISTLRVREPKSLKICTLLSKPEAHMMKTQLDYIGFEISNEFVIGYGLDLDGEYRNVPYIAQVISD